MHGIHPMCFVCPFFFAKTSPCFWQTPPAAGAGLQLWLHRPAADAVLLAYVLLGAFDVTKCASLGVHGS